MGKRSRGKWEVWNFPMLRESTNDETLPLLRGSAVIPHAGSGLSKLSKLQVGRTLRPPRDADEAVATKMARCGRQKSVGGESAKVMRTDCANTVEARRMVGNTRRARPNNQALYLNIDRRDRNRGD